MKAIGSYLFSYIPQAAYANVASLTHVFTNISSAVSKIGSHIFKSEIEHAAPLPLTKNIFHVILTEPGLLPFVKLSVCQWLCNKGACINDQEALTSSPLYATLRLMSSAVSEEELEIYVKIFDLLVLYGADIHAKDSSGKSLIWYMCRSKPSLLAITLLLEKGVLPGWNKKSITTSPLNALLLCFVKTKYAAKKTECLNIAKKLLECGLNIDAVDLKGRTVVLQATKHQGSYLFFKFLLESGAKLRWVDESAYSHSLLSILVKNYSLINQKERKKNLPFIFYCLCQEDAQLVYNYLICKDINDKNNYLDILKYAYDQKEKFKKKFYLSAYSIMEQLSFLENKKEMDLWTSIFPNLKKIGKIQKRMKVLFHALPSENSDKVNDFELAGILSISVHSKIKKYFLNFIAKHLKDECLSSTKAIIEEAFSSLSHLSPYKSLDPDPNSHLLIKIGGSDHASYLQIKDSQFICVDTGGICATEEIFNCGTPCVIGSFESKLLTEEQIIRLIETNKLSCDDPQYLEELKKILVDELHLDKIFTPYNSFNQYEGNCVWKGLVTLMGALHYKSEAENKLLNEDNKDSIETQQLSFLYLYDILMPLTLINESKLLSDANFLKERDYLPFVKDLYEECKSGEIWTGRLKDFQKIAKPNLQQKINEQYVMALERLEGVIYLMEND